MRIHITKVTLDGRDAWLVVPDSTDRILRWAMENAAAPVPIVSLPTFGGWLVPLASEGVLWGVLQAVYGDSASVACAQCLGSDDCEAWVQLVTQRYENSRSLVRYQAKPTWKWGSYYTEPRASRPETAEERPARSKPKPIDPRIDAAKRLGLKWPCSKSEITKAFRILALKSHPDLGGSDAIMRELLAAREILTASDLRPGV